VCKILQVIASLVGIIGHHYSFVFIFLGLKTPIGARHLEEIIARCFFNLDGERVVLDRVLLWCFLLLLLFLFSILELFIVLVVGE